MSEVPKGWIVARLEEIALINPRHSLKLLDSLPVTFVSMPALSETTWSFEFTEDRPLGRVRKGYTHFAEGDVLFAKITPCMENGKGAVASGLKNGLGCGTTEVHVIRLLGTIDPKYIYYYLHQKSFRREAAQNFTGTAGQLRVPVTFIKESDIPLAPFNEQHRIVAKLEKLLSRVESSQKRLERVPKILKRFRQSVLAAACSGKLTEGWRKENANLDTVAGIVASIHQRRTVTTKKVAEKTKLERTYSTTEEDVPYELPSDWMFVALNKLSDSLDYGSSAKSQPTGNVPVLRMGNIQEGKIDWTDLVYTSDSNEIRKFSLRPNTVLFNRTNSPELVGKTALYRGERPATFAGYLIRVNNVPELDPRYLNFCLNSNYAREFCASMKTDGVSQSNINAQKLGAFEVPFCSLTEQQEIVRRVEELFTLTYKIEDRYKKAKAQVDKLTQSILAKAFRGELVPQDPNDEPASMLLERIRRDRKLPHLNKEISSARAQED
jgi:type I restriction enzyme S subunit